MKRFNMNSNVKVQLTQIGLDELERQHNEYARDIEYFREHPFKPPKTDEDGYSTWQLHHLMSTLGHLCTLGFNPPFKTEMLFNETNLK